MNLLLKICDKLSQFLKTINSEHSCFPTMKPNMPFVSAPKKQNIPPHLPSRNAPTSENPNISLSVALGEQQIVLSAPTCVIHPITPSLSRQPCNMPTND